MLSNKILSSQLMKNCKVRKSGIKNYQYQPCCIASIIVWVMLLSSRLRQYPACLSLVPAISFTNPPSLRCIGHTSKSAFGVLSRANIKRCSSSKWRVHNSILPSQHGILWGKQKYDSRPHHDASLQMQQSSITTDITNDEIDTTTRQPQHQHHDAHLWFINMVPEGWCVGVCTTGSSTTVSSISDNDDTYKSSLNSTTLLHPEEYQWGQDNIASDTARTSYYLGRTALRLSLGTLLYNETNDQENENINNSNSDSEFYAQLHDQIQSTAIRKDYYGRPILPEIIFGSISHKGEYAVGLSRFRSSTLDGTTRIFDNGFEALDANKLQWSEECPILDDKDNQNFEDSNSNDVTCSSEGSVVRGIGIDLERIDAKRGKKIERKVLTENEQNELGGLEVSLHTWITRYQPSIGIFILTFLFY